MNDNRGRGPNWRGIRIAAQLSTVGLTLALSVGVGIGLGFLLDQHFKTKGVLVIVGTLFGVIAGFKQLIQTVIRANQDAENAERETPPPGEENKS